MAHDVADFQVALNIILKTLAGVTSWQCHQSNLGNRNITPLKTMLVRISFEGRMSTGLYNPLV